MATPGLRLGFVDYRLENFHANVFLKAFRSDLQARGAVVSGAFALDADNGRAWAAKNQVPYYATVTELNAQVDAFLILAPSNPETHLPLAELVLPAGKPTYIDKTFAPDLRTAQQIFTLADRHHAAVQTTSALRYTNVQTACAALGGQAALRHMVTWGSGSSFAEYAIHPLELAVSCLGPAAERVRRRGVGRESQLLVDFSGGRTLVVNVYCDTNTDFAASLTTAKETRLVTVDGARLFVDTAAGILDFLSSGTPTIPRAESLTIRRLLDLAADPRALTDFTPV